VLAESAEQVMVLPMHVVGDCAADGDVLGPGQHRQEPGAPIGVLTASNLGHVCQSDACLSGEDATLLIEGYEPIQAAAID
jgi:hypothetical protein